MNSYSKLQHKDHPSKTKWILSSQFHLYKKKWKVIEKREANYMPTD